MAAQECLRVILMSLLILATSALSRAHQPPKKGAANKAFTPAQIVEAEALLKAASCGLYRSEPRREPWEIYLPRPQEPPPPIDLVAFPNDTSDADLNKLLPYVKRLGSLKAVMLWRTSKITSKGLQLLVSALPDLQGLILNELTIPDGDLAELAAFRRMIWVEVTNCPIRDAGVRELAAIPQLTILTLQRNTRVTGVGIGHLANAKLLRELNVDITADSPGMSIVIGKLGELTHLNAYPVGDDEAAELGNLKRLTSLDLTVHDQQLTQRAITLTDAGLKRLMGCKSLISLKLSAPGVTIEKTPELTGLEELKELSLANTSTNDAGLEILSGMKALTRLELKGTAVSDSGVRGLADLPRLETLDLSQTQASDVSLENLTRVRSLRSLVMDYTQVSSTLPNLSAYGSLKNLSLKNTNVSLSSFRCLEKARSVLVMDLRGNFPNLSQPDIGPLEKALPNCKILVDSKTRIAFGWPGAIGFTFSLPNAKGPPASVKPGPPAPNPVVQNGPPQKAPPPAPVGPLGGNSSAVRP